MGLKRDTRYFHGGIPMITLGFSLGIPRLKPGAIKTKHQIMKLILLLLPFLAFAQCPVITQQPQSQADCEGNSIRMIVISNGNAFQWEKKRPQDANFSTIAGATLANYQIMPSGNSLHPTGTLYRVKISIGSCSIYSEVASIQIRKINTILNAPVCERGNGQLTANHSEGATHFQWMRSINGGAFEEIIDNEQFQGGQQNQLQIKQASKELDGQKFKIRIDFNVSPNNDNEGSLQNLNQTTTCPRTSAEITLQIKSSPIPRHAANQYAGCIEEAFSVNASGCSPYTTQWYDAYQQAVGSGARLLITLHDYIPHPLFATCVNAGCESLPSSGTQAKAFNKPTPPQNAGTPPEICPGISIPFQASGGSNNIWYLSASSTTPLSTATTISTIATPENSQLTRFVSQKINGCESDRTAISVQIRSNIDCNPIDNTNNDPPPDINPPPTDSSDSSLPHVQLIYQLQQNCESGTYSLHVTGCPVESHIDINRQVVLATNDWEAYVPENMEIQITCPASISNTLNILLPALRAPQIEIQTNYQNFVCEGDKTTLSIELPPGAQLVGWEFNGHLFAQQTDINEALNAGNYQAIIQRNGCTYRSEVLHVDVHTKPSPPNLIASKNQMCLGDSINILAAESHPFYLWNDQHTASTFIAIGKKQGQIDVYIQVSDDGFCWSNPSKSIQIRVNPIPERPQILVQKNGGFCRRDSVLLVLNKTGTNYRWSSNETSANIYSKKPESYEASWQDSLGCWSPPSNPIKTYYFPEEPQPRIQTFNRQFCIGESIILRATPAYAYKWSSNEQTDSIVVSFSNIISLKTKNEFGCWSPPSLPLHVVAQENPWMPKLIRSGAYFIQAINQEKISKYEWRLGKHILIDTTAQIKIRQSGLFQVRAVRQYQLIDAIPIQCFSPFQVASLGIPTDDPGVQVYPNPNKGEQLQVEIQEDLSHVKAELYSLQGKQIKQWQINDTQHILSLQISDITSGSYILILYAGNWSAEKRIFLVSD